MKILLTVGQIELIETLLLKAQEERGRYNDLMLDGTTEDFQLLSDHLSTTIRQGRINKDWYLTDEIGNK